MTNEEDLIQFQLDYKRGNIIHTQTALDPGFRNIGLGYKCYKAVINKVGWICSYERSTNQNSRRVWKHLIKDPDYFTFGIATGSKEKEDDGFLIFDKSKTGEEIKEVLKFFTVISYDSEFKN